MARPRVMFASYHCYQDPSSGAAVCTRDLFAALAARGWRCGAFTGPHLDDPAAPPVDSALRTRPGVRVTRGQAGASEFSIHTEEGPGRFPITVFVPNPPAAARAPSADEAAAFLAVLEEVFERFRPDIVLTYGGDPASAGVIARAKRAGAKVAFWLHNMAYWSADIFRQCDAVIVPSVFAQTHYRMALGIESVVLAGPFDPTRVTCDRATDQYVTFVNPEPAKGVFWFARLAYDLGTRRPDIPLLVVESRGRTDWLGRCGVDLRGVQSISRMPNTSDPRQFYRASRVVLIPSLVAETLSRVAVEAQMNGIPVIGSGRGGMTEALRPAGLELPIPSRYTPDTRSAPAPGEVAPWVEAIIRLWDDSESYERVSAAAQEGARKWHPDVLIPQWEMFLERLVARRPAV